MTENNDNNSANEQPQLQPQPQEQPQLQPQEQPKLLPFQKTKQERVADVKPIICKLNDFQLNMSYEPIRKMYKIINEYIKEGESRKINIAFPEVKRRIKGFLSDDTRKETWMKLEADD
jgi:hypothetical protein